MFTGIVQLGKIEKISKSSKGHEIEVSSSFNIKSIKIGESIAIDGACLSVVAKNNKNIS